MAQRSLVFPFLLLAALVVTGPSALAQGGGASDSPFDGSITTVELLAKARDAFGLEDLALADVFYQEILRREPAHVQAMLELANLYEREGRLEYARGLLMRAAQHDKDNPRIAARRDAVDRTLTLVLGEEVDELTERGDYEQALPKLSLLVTISPRNAEFLYHRAQCQVELGRSEAARDDLERAIGIDPQPRYYELRSRIVESLRDAESVDLKARARELAAMDTPAAQAEAVELLGEIMVAEPDDVWARDLYVRLTGSGTVPDDTSNAVTFFDRTVADSKDGAERAVRAVVGFVDRHVSAICIFLIALLIFRSPLTRAIAGLLTRPSTLSGRLSTFSLTEIMLMLNAESHTGILRVKSGTRRGSVYFENGEPCHCTVGKREGEKALSALLRDPKKGSFSFSDGIMPVKRSIDSPLTLILFENDQSPAMPAASTGKGATEAKSRMKALLEKKD